MNWWTIILVAVFGALALIALLVELIGWSERRRRAEMIRLERELLDAAINKALKKRRAE